MDNIIRYTSQVSFHNNIDAFLNSENEQTKITVLDNTEAFYGDETQCNVYYLKQSDIAYSNPKTFVNVGCIVGVKGNVIVDVTRKTSGGECLSDKFAKSLVLYFKTKGLDSARLDNNDVLIDDGKVASSAEIRLDNGMRYMGCLISINQDLEVIKNACTKPMIKVPKALSEYGITTEEMVKFCEDYWTKN